jgi:uncharacterized GH25 family protein
LQGRVLDSSRVPVAGALVQTGGSTPIHALTDDAGAFSLNLAPGTHDLRAVASGFAESTQTVRLDFDATTDFFLEPAALIRGRVVLRASGRPLPEATAILYEPGSNASEPMRATTDAGGAFEFGGLHAGRYRLFAQAGELVGQLADPLPVAAAARLSDLVLPLEPGARLRGMVRDGDGRPLPGVRVSVGLKVMPPSWAHTTTDGGGHFQLTGLLPGRGWLVAYAPGFLTREQPELEIPPGAPALTLDLTLERGALLEGRVLDAAGAPVAGAVVMAIDDRNTMRGNARSGPDGAFRIANLVSGRLNIHVVHAQRGDTVDGQVQLAPNGRAALDLQLQRPASASGRVDWQDGAPAAGVIVSATRLDGSLMRKSAKTDTGGRFQLAQLAPGHWMLDARMNIMRIAQSELMLENPGRRIFELAPGQNMQAITLTIAHLDRELRGTVVDPEGSPVAGAIVAASPLDPRGLPARDNAALMAEAEQRYQVTTGPDGSFRIGQLPEGTLWITAEHPGFIRQIRSGVPAGTRDLRLQLAR